MGDENENRALQILEGLATGKQQLAQLLTQLITTNQANQNHGGNNDNGGTNGHNRGNNGAGGIFGNNGNHAKGNNNQIPAHVGTRTTCSIVPRPLLPQFTRNQEVGNQG
jgi:hypothetical protein